MTRTLHAPAWYRRFRIENKAMRKAGQQKEAGLMLTRMCEQRAPAISALCNHAAKYGWWRIV